MPKLNIADLKSYLIVKKGLAPRTVSEGLIKTRTIENLLEGQEYSPASVERLIYSMKERKLKNSTINNYICQLKRIEEYLIDRGLGERFMQGIEYGEQERPVIDVLSVQEIKAILNTTIPYAKRGIDLNKQYLIFEELLALTGCRIGEAIGLRVKYFDSSGWVTFIETKTKTTRRVGIVEPLLSKLKEHIKNKGYEDYIFTTNWGNRLIDTEVNRDLTLRAKQAGIKKRVYPHLLRHSFITQLIASGVPISIVASIAGHADINTTNYYTHLANDSLRKALYRHPLIRENTDPQEIIENIMETLKSFRLQDDSRFDFQLLEGSNSLSFSIRGK